MVLVCLLDTVSWDVFSGTSEREGWYLLSLGRVLAQPVLWSGRPMVLNVGGWVQACDVE